MIPTEYEECVVFSQWLELNGLLFSHIPQETFTKNWGTKMKNKRMGVKRGLPDYIILTPKGLLFVEMKRTKGGNVKPDQEVWIKALNTLSGVQAHVCKGFEEAKAFVERFI